MRISVVGSKSCELTAILIYLMEKVHSVITLTTCESGEKLRKGAIGSSICTSQWLKRLRKLSDYMYLISYVCAYIMLH